MSTNDGGPPRGAAVAKQFTLEPPDFVVGKDSAETQLQIQSLVVLGGRHPILGITRTPGHPGVTMTPPPLPLTWRQHPPCRGLCPLPSPSPHRSGDGRSWSTAAYRQMGRNSSPSEGLTTGW